MATQCAFPDDKNPEHREEVVRCIRDALFDHQADGGLVEDGMLSSPSLSNH
jgi:hypothetical protein